MNIDTIDFQKVQKAFEENDTRKFGSLEEVYYAVGKIGHEYQLTYNNQKFFLASVREDDGKKIFTIADNHENKNLLEFNSFDELLDNYKVDGKNLREILLDFDIKCEY